VPGRNAVTRVLLVLYFLGSVAAAGMLAFDVGRAGDLAETTSGKVLAAALLAVGIGALLAARDPWRDRAVIQVIVVFTALSALAIVYRLAFEDHESDPAWLVLPFALAGPVLFLVFYPRAPEAGGGDALSAQTTAAAAPGPAPDPSLHPEAPDAREDTR
jgi:peptidoglycan/LPS O-acetylase OafA/YrhL